MVSKPNLYDLITSALSIGGNASRTHCDSITLTTSGGGLGQLQTTSVRTGMCAGHIKARLLNCERNYVLVQSISDVTETTESESCILDVIIIRTVIYLTFCFGNACSYITGSLELCALWLPGKGIRQYTITPNL